jgi:hypothetical protein
MKQKRYSFPITLMARLLHVSVSCFYDWLKRGVSKRTIQRNQQTILVKIAHEETRQSYGYIRLTKYLQAQGKNEYVRCTSDKSAEPPVL